MCAYMSNVCVTAVCIGTVGGDEGLLCEFCVLRLVDVENWWKMTDASWHVYETFVTVRYVFCVIRASDHVFTLILKENVSFVFMGQLKCCNPGHELVYDAIPDNRYLFCVSVTTLFQYLIICLY